MVGKFIVLEGPDGVGKSEIIKQLSLNLEYTSYKTPPAFYRQIRSNFDTPNINPLSRLFFYTAGVFAAEKEIKQILQEDKGVIVDRYVLSLQVYHEILADKDLSQYINNLNVLMPDLTIILTADISVLKDRRKERETFADSYLEENSEFMQNVLNKFQKINGADYFQIDTNKKNINEVVEICLKKINSLLPGKESGSCLR